jgi:integrase
MIYVKVVLFTSKTLKNGEHPIMVRFTKNGKTKYLSTGKSCTKGLWDKNENYPKKKHPEYKELKAHIDKKKHEANKLVLSLETEEKEFTLDQVAKKYKRGSSKLSFFEFTDIVVKNLESINRLKYASSFRDTAKAVSNYMNNRNLYFSEINYSFLKKFEERFLVKNPSGGGLALHMRNIRKLYNDAEREGYAKKEDYPFEDYKISKIPNSKEKNALTKEELERVIDLDLPSKSKVLDAKYFFLFSFYNRGMNLKDMANLKWQNIISNRIDYVRSKTKRSGRVAITDPVREILDYYRSNFPNDAGYVFPIYFARHDTEKKQKYRYDKIIGQVNRNLKEIARETNIEINVTFYVARHTWANLMRKMGKTVREISPGLLHGTESTTYFYMQELGDETINEANDELIDSFKKKDNE